MNESCVIPLSAKCRRLNIDGAFGILSFGFENFGSTFLIKTFIRLEFFEFSLKLVDRIRRISLWNIQICRCRR